ncbi:uncharacterized protein LOC113340224 [Papaver somniferum]|uniref:uncharacterized protein LOC113340224 n=1 Tax=Papaver somniferum TaxID=3469 RepID=UPI000E6FF7A7|nr:uncharacterized protein LOC113340224 [Papaver somniferum]
MVNPSILELIFLVGFQINSVESHEQANVLCTSSGLHVARAKQSSNAQHLVDYRPTLHNWSLNGDNGFVLLQQRNQEELSPGLHCTSTTTHESWLDQFLKQVYNPAKVWSSQVMAGFELESRIPWFYVYHLVGVSLVAKRYCKLLKLKRGSGLLKMPGRVTRSLSSERCFYCSLDVAGKVFDRGRLLELIKRYYYDRSSFEFSFGILNFSFVDLNGFIFMDTYDGRLVYEIVLQLGYGLELFLVDSNMFSLVEKGGSQDDCKFSDRRRQQVQGSGKVRKLSDKIANYVAGSLSRVGVWKIPLKELRYLQVFLISIPTVVKGHIYLSEIMLLHVSLLTSEIYESHSVRARHIMQIFSSTWSCLYLFQCAQYFTSCYNPMVGMNTSYSTRCLLPCYNSLPGWEYDEATESYSWTRFLARLVGTQVLLLVIQIINVLMLMDFLRCKFKLLTTSLWSMGNGSSYEWIVTELEPKVPSFMGCSNNPWCSGWKDVIVRVVRIKKMLVRNCLYVKKIYSSTDTGRGELHCSQLWLVVFWTLQEFSAYIASLTSIAVELHINMVIIHSFEENGLEGSFLVEILFVHCKKECREWDLEPTASLIHIVCINLRTYSTNTECDDVTTKRKVCYVCDYTQEMIKLEVFWEVLRLLDSLIRDKRHVEAVGKLIWQLNNVVSSKMRILSAKLWQSDINVEKEEHDLMSRIQLMIIAHNSASCGVEEGWIMSRVASGLVRNSSLALYFWRYKSNYLDKYGLGLHSSYFAGDFEFLSSREWQQLYWNIGYMNCIKCIIETAGVFVANTQPLFKQLQTSIYHGTTAREQEEDVNSMSASALQKFSIPFAISGPTSVDGHITGVIMHKFRRKVIVMYHNFMTLQLQQLTTFPIEMARKFELLVGKGVVNLLTVGICL